MNVDSYNLFGAGYEVRLSISLSGGSKIPYAKMPYLPRVLYNYGRKKEIK